MFQLPMVHAGVGARGEQQKAAGAAAAGIALAAGNGLNSSERVLYTTRHAGERLVAAQQQQQHLMGMCVWPAAKSTATYCLKGL
jgi:hypothetical protein